MMKPALITGITGQDGSYLAELLLEKGYDVHGTSREPFAESAHFSRIAAIKDKITLHAGDITDPRWLGATFAEVSPDEVYHLSGQKQSQDFEEDFATFPLNIDVTRNFLTLIRDTKPECRLFFAGSSEMFGKATVSPQNEQTPFAPISPYAISKVAGHFIVKLFREHYGLHASTGIFFNHESPRRDPMYLSRKVARATARISVGIEKELVLGDLNARRDWGYSPDFMEAVWSMLQKEKADDYVLGTGASHSVEDLVRIAFEEVGLDWKQYVKTDPALLRSGSEMEPLADITKAKTVLGWEPKTSFLEMIRIMIAAEKVELTAGK